MADQGGCSGYLIKAPPIRHANDSSLAKWHRRFFSIRENSKNLEYWEDDTMKVKKGDVDLLQCTKVRAVVLSKKFPHLFSLQLPDREWFFAAESDEQKQKWVDYLSNCCGDSIVRSQTVSMLPESYAVPTVGGSSRLSSHLDTLTSPGERQSTTFMARTEDQKPVWLRIAYPNLEMLDVASMKLLKLWPLAHMSGYGQEKTCFSFDIRKRFEDAGHYVMYLQLGDDMFGYLDKIVAEHSATAASEPSTPVGRSMPGSKLPMSTSTSSLPATNYSSLQFSSKIGSGPPDQQRPRATSDNHYTYVHAQTYVDIGSFTPKKTVALTVDENSSYAQVDIVRTEALGRALRKTESDSPQPSCARKTRHDGITLPTVSEHRTGSVTAIERDSGRTHQVRNISDPQDDLDDLLNSLDVEEKIALSGEKHSYVNLPSPI